MQIGGRNTVPREVSDKVFSLNGAVIRLKSGCMGKHSYNLLRTVMRTQRLHVHTAVAL